MTWSIYVSLVLIVGNVSLGVLVMLRDRQHAAALDELRRNDDENDRRLDDQERMISRLADRVSAIPRSSTPVHGVPRVNISRVEVASDDPDRFVAGMAEAFRGAASRSDPEPTYFTTEPERVWRGAQEVDPIATARDRAAAQAWDERDNITPPPGERVSLNRPMPGIAGRASPPPVLGESERERLLRQFGGGK